MTTIAPDPHWTPNHIQFDVNATEESMGLDLDISMMFERPQRDPMLPDTSAASRAVMNGTMFAQPINQEFSATKSPDERIALNNVFTQLAALDVLSDARELRVGESLPANEGRLMFEAPLNNVQGFPADGAPPAPQTAMYVVDMATLDQPKYEAFGQAFEAYSELAFPELSADGPGFGEEPTGPGFGEQVVA